MGRARVASGRRRGLAAVALSGAGRKTSASRIGTGEVAATRATTSLRSSQKASCKASEAKTLPQRALIGAELLRADAVNVVEADAKRPEGSPKPLAELEPAPHVIDRTRRTVELALKNGRVELQHGAC